MLVLGMTSMGSTFTSVRSLRYVIYPVQVRSKLPSVTCARLPINPAVLLLVIIVASRLRRTESTWFLHLDNRIDPVLDPKLGIAQRLPSKRRLWATRPELTTEEPSTMQFTECVHHSETGNRSRDRQLMLRMDCIGSWWAG